jgi:putative transposase
MPRVLRHEYPGAVYHVMARGDGGKRVFEDDEDRKGFLFRLGKVCECHGWRVHAWVLMGNHFHLLVETPEPNLVTGMKLLLGPFSQDWNRRRLRRGHVFQGRYKSVPVNVTESEPHYFRSVADYIHLNPARAGLAGGERGRLLDYAWSSLPSHSTGKGAVWLETGRLLNAFELAGDGRGRRAYVNWLEARAANDDGRIDDEAIKALRRGWYLGGISFRDQLLGLTRKVSSRKAPPGMAQRKFDESAAAALALEALTALGLPTMAEDLSAMRKGDLNKVLVASLLRERTSVGNGWIAKRLAMGHSGSVSRLVVGSSRDPGMQRKLRKLKKMLKCDT